MAQKQPCKRREEPNEGEKPREGKETGGEEKGK